MAGRATLVLPLLGQLGCATVSHVAPDAGPSAATAPGRQEATPSRPVEATSDTDAAAVFEEKLTYAPGETSPCRPICRGAVTECRREEGLLVRGSDGPLVHVHEPWGQGEGQWWVGCGTRPTEHVPCAESTLLVDASARSAVSGRPLQRRYLVMASAQDHAVMCWVEVSARE